MLRGVVYRLIGSLASMGHCSIWKLICAISVCNTLTVGVHLYQAPPALVVLDPPLFTDKSDIFIDVDFIFDHLVDNFKYRCILKSNKCVSSIISACCRSYLSLTCEFWVFDACKMLRNTQACASTQTVAPLPSLFVRISRK